MAYAHTQVNIISKVYLQSDRRYNYTTPKSFLEQISLYSKLLKRKSAELASKIDRLENGLDKLKSTANQVGRRGLRILYEIIDWVRFNTERVYVSGGQFKRKISNPGSRIKN